MDYMNGTRSFKIAGYLLYILLVSVPLFLHLDQHPLRLWDESRNAKNALEMYENGNFLVTHYEGAPEMWNTKPPLLIWLQVVFFHLLGPGELALRLPSALAGLGVCILLLAFSMHYLKSRFFAFITSIILITSIGFTQFHVTRTGDYDSLLVFFMSAYAFAFFAYTESGNKKHLNAFFLFLTLAVFTKSIQAFLFLPALALYAFIYHKHLLFLSKKVILPAFLFILSVGAYYLLREKYNPGYLLAVWDNELGGRYLKANENHGGEFLFYFRMLYNHHFSFWFWFFISGVFCLVLPIKQELKRIGLFSLLIALSYWLIVSLSQTKLEWYEAPLFPFMSLLAAIPLYLVSTIIINYFNYKKTGHLICSILLIVFFFKPYSKAINRSNNSAPFVWESGIYETAYVLQETLRDENEVPDYHICFEGYHAHLTFYTYLISKRGTEIKSIKKESLNQGARVWVSQSDVKKYIELNYEVQVLDTYLGATKYEVLKAL